MCAPAVYRFMMINCREDSSHTLLTGTEQIQEDKWHKMQQKKIKRNSFVLRRRRSRGEYVEKLFKQRKRLLGKILEFLPLEMFMSQLGKVINNLF